MEDPLQADRLGDELLERSTACHFVLSGELEFSFVRGAPDRLLPLPESVRDTWREKAALARAGQPVSWRERRDSRIFQVNLFPMPPGRAGGFAFDLTPWSDAERQLRETALEVLRAREDERSRLSRMLHDEVGQSLSVAGLQLDLLRMDLESTVPSIPARTAEIQQVLERVMERVREFSYQLNPSAVERVGLYPALDRLVGRVRKEFGGTLRFMADSTLHLPGPVASAFYRIAHDAIDNAVRHAGATRIEVLVKMTREGPVLEVRDNGRTFDPGDPEASERGLAQLVMEHFASRAGLGLTITSRRGQGTIVKGSYTQK